MMLTKSEMVYVTLAVQCVFITLSAANASGLPVAMDILAWGFMLRGETFIMPTLLIVS